MLEYLLQALTPLNITFALFGVVAGSIVGALPGLTATMAVAVLVPITFSLSPASALILLGAIYTGAIYGGAYSAILLNTPGTPSAIATTFDGYPMAQQGKGDVAITLACLSSVIGGLVGAFFLFVLAPPLAEVALFFGPVEYFWLALFGLTLVATLSKGKLLKGFIGASFGLLLAMVGVAEISADLRFTFATETLLGGIELISALIGLYCMPVLIDLVATPDKHLKVVANRSSGFRFIEAVSHLARYKIGVIRSSIIGTLVGILPGAGGSIASLVSYSEAQRFSKRADKFGTGEPQGVMATESANNATVGGGLIPTLVLGIPGAPPDAIILGALLIQGVRVGPNLFTTEGSIVYTFIFGLLLATILMLPVGLLVGRYVYAVIVAIPKAILVPSIAFLTIIGSYAIRNNVADVLIMIVLGAVSWLLKRAGFSPSPIVLGLILGRIAEQGFVQAWTIGSATDSLFAMFFTRPISLAIIVLITLTLAMPLWLARRKNKQRTMSVDQDTRTTEPIRDTQGIIVAIVCWVIGCLAWWDTTYMTDIDSYLFPRVIIIAMLIAASVFILWQWFAPTTTSTEPITGSTTRRYAIVLAMAASALMLPIAGFLLCGVLLFMLVMCIAMHETWTKKRKVSYVLSGCSVSFGFYALFAELLAVPLPTGILFDGYIS